MTDPLPHDPALPHLPQAMDMRAMAAHFDAMVAPHGLQVLHCELERAKYRPGRNCTLAYRMRVAPPDGGPAIDQRVAARLCGPGGDAARRAAKVPSAALVASAAGPALRLLPALNMLTWWWPNDPVLPAPRVLADERRMRGQVLPPLLPLVLPQQAGGPAELSSHTVEVVQYVPEQRLAARVTLAWSEGGTPRRMQVYAKSSREPDAQAAHQMLAALQASDAWREGRLRTPRAWLCQPEFGLHWQQAMPGRPWIELPAERQRAMAPELGAQLAALHATPVATARVLDLAALRARLAEVVPVLHDALPDARAALADAAAALAASLDELAAPPAATLHGDLHPRNLLVDGEQLALIDLDGLRQGAAVLELGAWVADSIYRALLDGAAPLRDQAAWQAMLEGYARAAGLRPAPAELALATAWNLLTQRAWRSVVNLKRGRLAIAPALVAQAAALARAHRMEPA